MEWFIICMYIAVLILVALTAINMRRQKYILQNKLDKLVKKSQLEQDIELATTEQLMSEVGKRTPGFILILPTPTNRQGTGMNIHIKGMPPQVAAACLSAACHLISTTPPSSGYQEF